MLFLFLSLFITITLALAEDTNNDKKDKCTNSDSDSKKCESRLTLAIGLAVGISSLVVILLFGSIIYCVRRRRRERHAHESEITFEIEPSQIAGPPASIIPPPVPALPATTYNPAYDPAVAGKSDRIRANLNKSSSSRNYLASKTKYPFAIGAGFSNRNLPPVVEVPPGKI